MFSPTAPTEMPLTAGFRARPEHTGTIHDDASARQFGYRGALVPGVILYGNMADVVVRNWGCTGWRAAPCIRTAAARPMRATG